MSEKITITIAVDKEGNIKAKVEGIKGPGCVDEIEKLLDEVALIEDMKKTEEYFMEPDRKVLVKGKSTIKGGSL